MGKTWGYDETNGPSTWSKFYPAGCGDKQSPIDINPVHEKSLNPIKKLTWKYVPENTDTVKNTGHGWKVDVDGKGSELSGGPLEDTYILKQFHCHWGATNSKGSEHTVNGKSYAGELHLVHWNSKYGTFEEACKHQDGLCVLGIFLKLKTVKPDEKVVTYFSRAAAIPVRTVPSTTEQDFPNRNKHSSELAFGSLGNGQFFATTTNFLDITFPSEPEAGKSHHELNKIVKKLSQIEYKDKIAKIEEPLDPSNFIPQCSGYWTYQGSLTTPPCNECVIWIVFEDPIEVSDEQLKAFRSLRSICAEDYCPSGKTEEFVNDNFRPTLPLGTRELRKCNQ